MGCQKQHMQLLCKPEQVKTAQRALLQVERRLALLSTPLGHTRLICAPLQVGEVCQGYGDVQRRPDLLQLTSATDSGAECLMAVHHLLYGLLQRSHMEWTA